MTRRTAGLISIFLVVVVSMGALITVPAVRAVTTLAVSVAAKVAANTKIITLKTATLKTLGQQVSAAAKTVREKFAAAKAAGKDLTAFEADIATALKGSQALLLEDARIYQPVLTKVERTQLNTAQAAIQTKFKNLQTGTKAGVPQAKLDALKVSYKAAVQARDALLRSFKLSVQIKMLKRLDNLITDCTKQLAVLKGLLAKLP